MPPRVLILGGTGEARRLAAELLEAGFVPLTSLAGVTSAPALPAGAIRSGGFGGARGLAAFLQAERFAAVVDASHPFAARISQHAAIAASTAAVPLLRLERNPWLPQPGDRWIRVPDAPAAAAALPAGARALVTIGRKEIASFFDRGEVSGIARMIETPACAVPENWMLLLQRPPYLHEAEAALMAGHRISHLVTKNAGGHETEAKLTAARQARIPVIMVERPVKPGVPTFSTSGELIAVLRGMLSP
jgi:precorrin-6A/cobalt-precorrin-6A reductase